MGIEEQKQGTTLNEADPSVESSASKKVVSTNDQNNGHHVFNHREEMFGDYYNDPLGR